MKKIEKESLGKTEKERWTENCKLEIWIDFSEGGEWCQHEQKYRVKTKIIKKLLVDQRVVAQHFLYVRQENYL